MTVRVSFFVPSPSLTKPLVANDEPGTMQPGDVFTIEPALIAYSLSNLELPASDSSSASPPVATDRTLSNGDVFTFLDGWTVATMSGARAAQAEHTVMVTEDGVEILTARENGTES
jgi:methionyl aminopeptidase